MKDFLRRNRTDLILIFLGIITIVIAYIRNNTPFSMIIAVCVIGALWIWLMEIMRMEKDD